MDVHIHVLVTPIIIAVLVGFFCNCHTYCNSHKCWYNYSKYCCNVGVPLIIVRIIVVDSGCNNHRFFFFIPQTPFKEGGKYIMNAFWSNFEKTKVSKENLKPSTQQTTKVMKHTYRNKSQGCLSTIFSCLEQSQYKSCTSQVSHSKWDTRYKCCATLWSRDIVARWALGFRITMTWFKNILEISCQNWVIGVIKKVMWI